MEKKVLLSEEQPGFGEGLLKALAMEPAEVVKTVKDSGIRGRGGAGFPAGLKWSLAADASSNVKYVVCNADEGEPGTFKDRVLIENYSRRLFEGMALLESLEGRAGLPRNKPPYPVSSGYLGKPTVINNVETFCAIPHIILNGAEWYFDLGVGECSGTKLFSISGDVERPGVYELPMGSPLEELLELAGADDVQAVQVGGASGRTIAAKDLGKPLSFKGLPPGGSVIVFDSSVEMTGVLENFMEFFVHESCGQCTPCREGTPQLLKAVEAVMSGAVSSIQELDDYFTLARVMKTTSKCGLGQTAANCFVDIITGFTEFHGDGHHHHGGDA
ncbi:MAG: hypothetical protein B1H09_06310 [Gemmatimonadaceae bacterium 4484_173]|nr:MAG: hypothetical protein B1H09_06310 [Gemmatimonadaceae bacterium 4484_173]